MYGNSVRLGKTELYEFDLINTFRKLSIPNPFWSQTTEEDPPQTNSESENNLYCFTNNRPIDFVDKFGLWGPFFDRFSCCTPNFRQPRSVEVYICVVHGFSVARTNTLRWLEGVGVARLMMIEGCVRFSRTIFNTGCENLYHVYDLYW